MKTKEEVLQLLVDLGADEKAVVNKLLSMGIKGDPRNCKVCPIAQYLISNGVGVGVQVGVEVEVGVEGEVGHYWFLLPDYSQVKQVYDFIRSFDMGKYPQLESKNCDV